VSQYQKGKTNLNFTEARDSEWQRHQLGHMQVCTLLQTDNHTSTPPLWTIKVADIIKQQQQWQWQTCSGACAGPSRTPGDSRHSA